MGRTALFVMDNRSVLSLHLFSPPDADALASAGAVTLLADPTVKPGVTARGLVFFG